MITKAIVKTNNFFTHCATKINEFDQTEAGGFVAGFGLIAIFALVCYCTVLYMAYKHK